MRIIDTFPNIVDTFSNTPFRLELWEEYIHSFSASLVKKVEDDSRDYDFNREILPVISHLLENWDKAERAHESFVKAVYRLPQRMLEVFGVDVEAMVLFYLGLCNGAGWATEMNNQAAVLLGVEKIVELDWCGEWDIKGLLYHELGHIWHKQVRKTEVFAKTYRQKALWQLYSEGIAMYGEQLLCGDHNFFHQNRNGWFVWCQKNQSDLFSEFLRRMDNDGGAKPFFGDWNQLGGWPDTGYYLGAVLVNSLAKEYGLQDLADLDFDTVERKLISYLT